MPDPLELGKQVIEVLEKGRKASTYKLAVLMALIECSVEKAPGLHDSVGVRLDDLAVRVIERYWQQTRPLPRGDNEPRPLRQSGQATVIIDAISEFRAVAGSHRSLRLDEAKRIAPDAYTSMFRSVKRTLVRYPLALLQRIPGATGSFLYDDTWMQDASPARIDRDDNKVELHYGVAFALAQLAGLLRPALEYLWLDKVWKSNQDFFHNEVDLKRYLFEEDRVALTRIRPALREAFGAKCFYCGIALTVGGHVDHVLPLSVVPINGLANLVLACQPCNSSKSDYLPALGHVERALGIPSLELEPRRDRAMLEHLGATLGWDAQYERVFDAARGTYKLATARTRLWRAVDQIDDLPAEMPSWITT